MDHSLGVPPEVNRKFFKYYCTSPSIISNPFILNKTLVFMLDDKDFCARVGNITSPFLPRHLIKFRTPFNHQAPNANTLKTSFQSLYYSYQASYNTTGNWNKEDSST